MQRTPISFKSWFGTGHWRFLTEVSQLDLDSDMVTVFGMPMIQILALCLDFECERTSMFFKSWLWTLVDAEGSGMGFAILILIWIWSLVFGTAMIWMLALYLDFEGAKTIHILKSWFGALEDAGGSWLGFGILILIWIWSLVFDTPMIPILALYLDLAGAKNSNVL